MGQLKSFGGQVLAVGAMFTAARAVVTGYGTAAVGMSNTFETSMAKIEGLVGINHDQVKAWGEELLQLGPKLGKSPQELADALFYITSAGLRGTKAMDALVMSAKAGTAGLGSTAVVADAVTSAMNAYSKSNLTAAQATDVMVAAVREGKLDADKLAPAIGRILPIASAMGIGFAEIGGQIAVMTQAGLSAEEATVALSAMLTTLAKPSKEAGGALAGVGLSMKQLREIATGPGGVVRAFRIIDRAMGEDIEAFEKVVPNVRAVKGALNLLSRDASVVDSVLEGVRNSVGDTDRAFAVMAKTMAQAFNRAVLSASSLMIQVGLDIAKIAGPAFDALGFAVREATAAWKEMSPAAKTAVILSGAAVTTLVPAFAALGLLGPLVARGAVAALAPLGMLAGAIGGVVSAVAGLAASAAGVALTALKLGLMGLGAAAGAAFDVLKFGASAAVFGFKAIGTAVEFAAGAVSVLYRAVGIANDVVATLMSVGRDVTHVFASWVAALGPIAGALAPLVVIATLAGGFVMAMKVGEAAVGGIASGLSAAGDAARDAFGSARDAAAEALPRVWRDVQAGAASAFASVKSTAVAAWESVRETGMAVWPSISAAAREQRWGDVMTLATAAIMLEWAKLSGWLSQRWIDLKETFSGVALSIADLMSDAWAGIESAWVRTSSAIERSIANLTRGMVANWEIATGTMEGDAEKVARGMAKLFDPSIAAEEDAALEKKRDDQLAEIEARKAERKGAIGDAGAALKEGFAGERAAAAGKTAAEVAKAKADLAAAIAAAGGGVAAAKADLDAAKARADEAAAEVTRAKADLDAAEAVAAGGGGAADVAGAQAALDAAAKAAADRGIEVAKAQAALDAANAKVGGVPGEKPGRGEGFASRFFRAGLDQAGEGVKQALGKGEAVGTFSASIAGQIGGKSLDKEQLEVQKQIEKNTRQAKAPAAVA